MMKKLEEHWTS